MNQLSLSEITSKVDDLYHRLLWTGSAANGALLLALVNSAANGSDNAASLRSLTIPIGLGAIGFLLGGAAINCGIARTALRPQEALAQTRIERANRKLEGFEEVLSASPLDPGVAQLVWGENAEEEARKLLRDRLLRAQEAWNESPREFETAIQELADSARSSRSLLRGARYWLAGSFVMATLSIGALVVPAWMNDARTVAPQAAPAVQPLPACPKGRATCDPWERDWKKPPPVGTVVPAAPKPATKVP